jgi:catechol 2,3-dioxygenase-like lactoylglutathione lyase family enzyme
VTARHQHCPCSRTRLGALGLLLALLLGPQPGAAARTIPWFDLELLPTPVRASLIRHRKLACGAVGADDLPLPDGVRLVFVSCHGGPYACSTAATGLDAHEQQLACPPGPTSRQIATMHVVSRRTREDLQAFYRDALGERFVELTATVDGDSQTTFVESAAAGGGLPWSPKRLHLTVTTTREPFRGAGYPSQARITLSVSPPSEPRPVVRCRDFDVRSPYDRRYERRSRSRAERFCWW